MKPLHATLALPLAVTALMLLSTDHGRGDQVFTNDVIIQGSLGIGFDAVNNENFGFDTVRLKENNTRIGFDDTSTNGTPNNKWGIVANDSASGGRNFLGIRDSGQTAPGNQTGNLVFYVMAGARNNAFMVNSNSRIGVGTNNPALTLHLLDEDSPGLRLEQVAATGFTNQVWDVGGNEVNFFIRDVTAGDRLAFRIRPTAPDDSLVVSSNGVGIGTSDPRAKLHVVTTGNEGVIIGSSGVLSNQATLHVDGTVFVAQTLSFGSSRERKENIREITLAEARAALAELRPVQFRYKSDQEEQLGFIAEEVPDLVAMEGRMSLAPMDFVAVLTKVVQDHETRQRQLESVLEAQDAMFRTLEARLNALEQQEQPMTVRADGANGSSDVPSILALAQP